MKKILLLLLMFAGINIPVLASNWALASVSRNGVPIYIDKENIQYHNGYADVWAKRLNTEDNTETVFLIRITQNKQYLTLSLIKYDKQGHIIESVDRKYDYTYQYIPPDSMAEGIYETVYYN